MCDVKHDPVVNLKVLRHSCSSNLVLSISSVTITVCRAFLGRCRLIMIKARRTAPNGAEIVCLMWVISIAQSPTDQVKRATKISLLHVTSRFFYACQRKIADVCSKGERAHPRTPALTNKHACPKTTSDPECLSLDPVSLFSWLGTSSLTCISGNNHCFTLALVVLALELQWWSLDQQGPDEPGPFNTPVNRLK